MEAEDHRIATNGVRQASVVVQARPQILQCRQKAGIAAQRATRQRLQRSEARTLVRFGQDHIQPQQQGAVVGEDTLDQLGQPRPAPRPAPQLGQRTLVDIDNHDPFVDRRLREKAHAGVVEHRFQALQRRDLQIVQALCEQHRKQQYARQVAQNDCGQASPDLAKPLAVSRMRDFHINGHDLARYPGS
ncbi:MAG: hypothetical protein AW10_02813 [Candidatus Accumulibacter appositus]|uniref:Uncharacterized protein n=1 Tax=Candidatus Accumulibacter appositus TaxID=1454003 RepID=A0A011QII4_9PROT|nr:MAG: hypothetical protein AW10_02813 [Candidatus Accumulibacter appositus]